MTTAPPPPIPPPLPPPAPPPARASWFLPVVGGGAVLAVVAALFATGVFSADPPAAGDTSTTAAATTVAPVATTQVATTTAPPTTATTLVETTTTQATPTTATTLLFDDFEGTTGAVALFGPETMELTVANGRGRLRALVEGVVLPAMYPDSVGAVTIEMRLRLNLVSPGAGAGLLVFAEDPADGGTSHYVLVLLEESSESLVITPYSGAFGPETRVPLPAAAGFDPDGFNDLRLVLAESGAIEAILNDTTVLTWPGPAPATTGWFGLVIARGGADDVLVVEELRVTG